MKKYLYFLIIVPVLAVFISACDSTTTGPDGVGGGSIYIQSTPAGAQIWVDGEYKSKLTPDSVSNLSAGSHQVTLKLAGFRDTTFSVNVNIGLQASRSLTLVSDLTVSNFGPVRIWETAGTSASKPSGFDLSTGTAVSSTDANADIYYSSAGFVVRTSATRSTSFFVGSSSNLSDGTDSPLASGSWTDRISDSETNYVFLFDQDLHYSKIKIVNSHLGSGPGDPSWVDIQGYYNVIVNDRRF